MRGCLRDRTLLSLYAGEGRHAHRAHLQACVACATRYQTLVHDLQVLRQALREPPPRPAIPQRPLALRIRWKPVAAALAVTLAIVWGGMWVQRPSPPLVPTEARNEAVLLFLEEVSTALFSTAGASAAAIPASMPGVAYLEAALEGELEEEWPCEGAVLLLSPECDLYVFPPFIEEPEAKEVVR
ncbi:MAG: hypothetical protein HYZ81_23920 [Nitrospinae bacterium]|nr:hypothetical protein [Nitrospinota bacterium]